MCRIWPMLCLVRWVVAPEPSRELAGPSAARSTLASMPRARWPVVPGSLVLVPRLRHLLRPLQV